MNEGKKPASDLRNLLDPDFLGAAYSQGESKSGAFGKSGTGNTRALDARSTGEPVSNKHRCVFGSLGACLFYDPGDDTFIWNLVYGEINYPAAWCGVSTDLYD